MRTKLLLLLTVALWMVFITGCASERQAGSRRPLNANGEAEFDEDFAMFEEEMEENIVVIADPLEPLNRVIYGFNDVVYVWIVDPVTSTYEGVVPEDARIGIRNFFDNVTTPIRYVNCLLQGKGNAAGTELDRFLINTTVGVLGFGDPAKDQYGIEPTKEDLGQTLAVWGLGDGFYVVLPLFGPSTLRDAAGFVGDRFLNPTMYLDPREAAIGASALKGVNAHSFHLGEYEDFKEAAVDAYVAMRQAYIQYRKKKIEE